jgi:hypothetical protein
MTEEEKQGDIGEQPEDGRGKASRHKRKTWEKAR